MTTSKIAILGGLLTLLTGGSAAIVTKDKWWPSKSEGNKDGESASASYGAGYPASAIGVGG